MPMQSTAPATLKAVVVRKQRQRVPAILQPAPPAVRFINRNAQRAPAQVRLLAAVAAATMAVAVPAVAVTTAVAVQAEAAIAVAVMEAEVVQAEAVTPVAVIAAAEAEAEVEVILPEAVDVPADKDYSFG